MFYQGVLRRPHPVLLRDGIRIFDAARLAHQPRADSRPGFHRRHVLHHPPGIRREAEAARGRLGRGHRSGEEPFSVLKFTSFKINNSLINRIQH